MAEAVPVEKLLRQLTDQLARQERRLEALEASLPGVRSCAGVPPATAQDTPPVISWPTRSLHPTPRPEDVRYRLLEDRLREAEDRLREAARLETVGRLVAGVAHDFSNLLTVIVGSADAIRSRLPDGDPLREAADTIAETAHTAASVTRQLLGFARPTDPAPCPLDANVAIQGLHRTLRRLVGERVTVDVLPAARLPLILADPGQFDRVLLNLVVNARDAIAGVGTVTVRTAAAQVPPGRPGWPADLPPGEFVAVTVSDTGVGMTQEVLGRIFDPFFTTKGERGTGLGLATVRELVRAAGGHVEVESSPGWGTSVRVFWPALRDEPTDRPRLVR